VSKAPIPAYTVINLSGAIGDVMRASAAWGQADGRGEDVQPFILVVMQNVAQLMALCLQREPTEAELMSVIGG
jgi:hypothetical protein